MNESRKYEKSLSDLEREVRVDPADMVEEQVASALHRPRLAPGTVRSYELSVASAKEDLGAVPLARLRPSRVQAAVARWQTDYAATTVAVRLAILRQALDAAVDDGLLATNPATRVKRAPAARRRDSHLNDGDVAALLGGTKTDDDRVVLEVLAFAGLRLGEALGLRVEDVDWLGRAITVRRSADTTKASRADGPTKTGSSVRTVPVDDGLLAALSAYVARHHGQGAAVNGSAPLLVGLSGRPLTRGMVDALFSRVATASGVVTHPHALRHYYGASMVSRGVPIPLVAKWMGHASPVTTMRVYAYAMPRDEETGRAALQAARGAVAEADAGRVRDDGVTGPSAIAEIR